MKTRRGIAAARFHADRGALPGQGERRRPRTLVIVLFVTEKYNALAIVANERVRPARGGFQPRANDDGGRSMTETTALFSIAARRIGPD